MTALDLDRLEALARAWLAAPDEPLATDPMTLVGDLTGAVFPLVSEARRLAAESEARRLVLALKATELRQEWLRAERAEEALREAADDLSTWLERDDNPFGPTPLHPDPCAPGFVRDRLRAALSPLPAPQPAPEVKP